MTSQVLMLGQIEAEVVLKDIKHVHLSVYPPSGRVRIAAPENMSIDSVRAYAATRLDWIKKQQQRILRQERETARDYVSGESHYLWGVRYRLQLEDGHPRSIAMRSRKIILRAPLGSSRESREEVMEDWLRTEIRRVVNELLPTWELAIGVSVDDVIVRRMKTKWGSATPAAHRIRLNTELAKKPRTCLEYILVHELVHLIVPNHGQEFVALMDKHLPDWRERRELLNSLPVRHENWMW